MAAGDMRRGDSVDKGDGVVGNIREIDCIEKDR